MQRDVVSVEANLLAKRARLRYEKRVTIKEESSTSSSNAKLYTLVRTMERMMEIINIVDRAPPRENQPRPQIRNHNFRRNPPQINKVSKEAKMINNKQLGLPFKKLCRRRRGIS